MSTFKYVSKAEFTAEKKSEEMKEIYRNMAQWIDDETPIKQIFTKLMMARAAQRDFGKPEVMHYCECDDSFGKSFNVRKINLDPNYSVELDVNDKEYKIKPCDYLHIYANRPKSKDFEEWTFDHFTKLFKVNRKSLEPIHMQEREMKKDVRQFIPDLSANPNGKRYGEYCKYQILRYSSWRDLDQWSDENKDSKFWIRKYHEFLKNAAQNIVDDDAFCKDFDCSDQILQQLDDGEEINVPWILDEENSWSMGSGENPFAEDHFKIERDPENYVDKYGPSDIPTFLINLKADCKAGHELECSESCIQDIKREDLMSDQRKAFDIVDKHFKRKNHKQLLMLVLGTAGTGKTCLIHALKKLLQDKSILTAPTGVAGNNCEGQTLDSLINCVKETPLKGRKLQEKMKDVQCLIIDEFSMVSSTKLARLDRRLRQIYPEKKMTFHLVVYRSF